MIRFFQKTPTDLSFLHTDVHSHILPGIDDGAPDIDTSLELIRGLQALGYRRLVATPHVMADFYPNTYDTIEAALQQVQKAVRKAKLDVRIEAGAEYHIDEQFLQLVEARAPLRTLPGNRVLVELSMVGEPPGWEATLFKLQTLGYKPVLAHPERYLYLRPEIERLESLRERGIELQVNLLSLDGYYGIPIKQFAHQLFKKELVDLVGSDCHHAQHLERLQALLHASRTMRMLEKATLLNQELPSERSKETTPSR